MALTINGRTIRHVYRGTKAIDKIYRGLDGGGVEQARNITFESSRTGVNLFYTSPPEASVLNNILLYINYFPSTYVNSNFINKYRSLFSINYLKTKFPIKIEIGSKSFNLTYDLLPGNRGVFNSPVIASSADRVSASDLTKAIQFELVDNEQVVSRVLNNGYRMDVTGGSTGVVYDYRTSGSTNQKWAIWRPTGTVFDKTVTGIIINGRRYSATYNNDPSNPFYTTDVIQDTGFYPTATGQSFGVNVEFSDETYWLNTRSKLFSTPDAKLVWQRSTGIPTISSFSVSPNNINLDNRPSGNITIAFTATAGSDGSILRAFVTEKSTGSKIGLTYASTNNAPITESFTIPQPTETETYVLTAVGNSGSVTQEVKVTVTEGGPNEISALMTNPGSVDLDTSPSGNITLSYSTKGKRNRLNQGSTNIPVLDTLQADSAHDIDLPSGFWRGVCSDGFTIWALLSGANFLRAYNALSKARDTNKDISLGAGNFVGCVYNQGRIWVTVGNEARPYSTDTYRRDTTAGVIALGSGNWTRAFSNDVTIWFIDNTANYARAWNASTLARDSNKDMNLGSGAWDGAGQSDTAIYLLDRNIVPPALIAFTKQDIQRRATKDFSLPQADASNNLISYRGVVGASGLVFMLDDSADKLYAYKKIEESYLSNKRWPQKDIDLGSGGWRGACTDGTTIWIANSTTSMAVAWTAPTLRTPAVRVSNRDFALLGGGTIKGLVYSSVGGGRIWAIDNSTLARCYESGPGIRDETRDITHGYTDAERGIANESYIWIVRGNRNAEAFRISDRTPQSSQLINLPTGNYEGGAINTGPSLYFVNRNAFPPALHAYDQSTRAGQGTKNFTLPNGQYRGAVSVGRLAWFIDISTNKAIAYYLDADFSDQTIPQPTQDTSYRLVSLLDANSYNADTTVQVNQSPALSNLLATGRGGSQGAPQGVTIQITGRVVGYPRPSIGINMGWRSPLTDRHFTRVGVNTWTFIDTHFFGTSGRRTLNVTAQNRSGTTNSDVTFNG